MKLKRWIILMAATLLCSCVSQAGLPLKLGDCATIRVWSNGWHANLALRADLFAETHTFRKLFPDAEYFLIGWGERDFYMAENAGIWKGLKAIAPPSPSVIHVIAGENPVEESLWPPRELAEFAVSKTGVERMAEAIEKSLAYDEEGSPIVLGEGRVGGASVFLAARGNFHLFNMCNHWMARRLREAGLGVVPAISFTAGGLIDAARETPALCPDGD